MKRRHASQHSESQQWCAAPCTSQLRQRALAGHKKATSGFTKTAYLDRNPRPCCVLVTPTTTWGCWETPLSAVAVQSIRASLSGDASSARAHSTAEVPRPTQRLQKMAGQLLRAVSANGACGFRPAAAAAAAAAAAHRRSYQTINLLMALENEARRCCQHCRRQRSLLSQEEQDLEFELQRLQFPLRPQTVHPVDRWRPRFALALGIQTEVRVHLHHC
jgi:hypothetical protein